MKKVLTFTTAVLFAMTLFSCNEAKMDPAAVQATVDSLAAGKIEAANAAAVQECETRMATEVKPMADSLVSAAKAANAPQ